MSTLRLRVVRARSSDHADRLIPDVLPWIHDAANPYWDWFVGDADTARAVLASWMRRHSSEVASAGLTLMMADEQPVGGYIALDGAALARCRRADSAAALGLVGRPALPALLTRMQAGRALFGPLDHAAFYLSKVGVVSSARGAGLGRALVEDFLRQGAARGFDRFRLDVSEDNDAAVHLYRSLGFVVERRASSEDGALRYLNLVLRRTA